MRKKITTLFLTIIGISLMTAGTASAENSLKTGAKALSFGIADGDIEISGRYLFQDDLAVLVGFGFAVTNNDETETDLSLSAGIRKYLSKADLTTFIGAGFSYDSDDETVPTAGGGTDVDTTSTFGVNGHFGAEYFFSKYVSAEAQIGFGLSDSSDGADETIIGTFRSAVSANFYLP